jgi:hypothetical protein
MHSNSIDAGIAVLSGKPLPITKSTTTAASGAARGACFGACLIRDFVRSIAVRCKEIVISNFIINY